MTPCQNCGLIYHISRGEWIVSFNMGYDEHFSYTTMMNEYVSSPSKMEPTRSLILEKSHFGEWEMNVLILWVRWNQREVLFGEWELD
jgi:hypothetical protein